MWLSLKSQYHLKRTDITQNKRWRHTVKLLYSSQSAALFHWENSQTFVSALWPSAIWRNKYQRFLSPPYHLNKVNYIAYRCKSERKKTVKRHMKKSLAKQRERGYNVKCLDTHFRALFHVRLLNSGILSWNKKKDREFNLKK